MFQTDDEDLESLVGDKIIQVEVDEVVTDAMRSLRRARTAYKRALDYYNKLEKDITTPGQEVRAWYDQTQGTYFYERLVKP